MAQNRNALRAGIFIVITLLLIAGMVIAIQGLAQTFAPQQVRTISFQLHDDLGGLQTGDPVRLGGFAVGTVTGIDLQPPAQADQDPGVSVTIRFPRQYVLRKGAVVQVQGTLTGASWLNISSLGRGAVLAPGDLLAGEPSAMAKLLEVASGLGPQVQTTIKTVNDQVLPALHHDLDKLGDAVDSIQQTSFAAHKLVEEHAAPLLDQGTGLMTDLRDRTVPNLTAAAVTLKQKLPDLMDHADALMVSGQKSVETAGADLVQVQATLANMQQITESLKTVLVGSRSKLSAIIAELKTTSDNLKNASADVWHSPWRLLYQPKKGEVENLNLYDSTRQFADAANALRDASQALRDATSAKQVDAAQVQALMDNLQAAFGKFGEAERGFWEKVKP